MFTTLREAVTLIEAGAPPDALTLSTTSNFLTNWLVPRLPLLHRQLPDLELRFHSSTSLVDVRGAMADCAIRYSMQADESLESTLLWRDRFVLVASPAEAAKPAGSGRTHAVSHRKPPCANAGTGLAPLERDFWPGGFSRADGDPF
jgi:DNA-binding transcriptional LysR family regulator